MVPGWFLDPDGRGSIPLRSTTQSSGKHVLGAKFRQL